jgi:predicted RND superfamily exporter protein
MKKKVCIMCAKEKDGLEVKSDFIINAIRWIKRNITKNEKNYTLVVCKDDFLNYKKKRESYERKMVLYVVIGIIFMIALAVVSNAKLGAIAVGLIITLFLFLLAQLSYMPAVDMPQLKVKSIKK